MNPLWILSWSAIGALLPMLAYTLIVWWLDRHEREPLILVGLSLLYGALPAACASLVLSSLVQQFLAPLVLPETFRILATTIFVPIIEETAKAIPLFFFRKNTNFNNATDGIVYGSAIGFGFGMTENLFYFLGSFLAGGYTIWIWTILLRTLFSSAVHAFTTGLAGYFIGRIKFSPLAPAPLLAVGLGVAVLGHVGWNSMVIAISGFQALGQFQFLLVVFPVVFLCLYILMQYSLREEIRIIRQELAEEATIGVITPSFFRRAFRFSSRWGRAGLRLPIQREYLTLGSRLAFMKRERRFEHCPARQAALSDEIEALRYYLRQLSQNNDIF